MPLAVVLLSPHSSFVHQLHLRRYNPDVHVGQPDIPGDLLRIPSKQQRTLETVVHLPRRPTETTEGYSEGKT